MQRRADVLYPSMKDKETKSVEKTPLLTGRIYINAEHKSSKDLSQALVNNSEFS